MLGRAELEEIHLVKDRDWRGVRGGDWGRFVEIQRDQVSV